MIGRRGLMPSSAELRADVVDKSDIGRRTMHVLKDEEKEHPKEQTALQHRRLLRQLHLEEDAVDQANL